MYKQLVRSHLACELLQVLFTIICFMYEHDEPPEQGESWMKYRYRTTKENPGEL